MFRSLKNGDELWEPKEFINLYRRIIQVCCFFIAFMTLLSILLKTGVFGEEAILYHRLSRMLAEFLAVPTLVIFILSIVISFYSQRINILRKRHNILKKFLGIASLFVVFIGFVLMFTYILVGETDSFIIKLLILIFIASFVLFFFSLFFQQMIQLFLDFHKPAVSLPQGGK